MNGIDSLRNELYEIDSMSVEHFQGMRDARFAKLVLHHYRNNEPYRKLLEKNGIENEEQLPKMVSDIGRLPLTDREWFESVNMHENPSVPKEHVRKYIETSGSTGRPFFIPYSDRASMEMGGRLFARAIIMAGINPDKPAYIVMHWIPGEKDVWASHEAVIRYKELDGKCIDESTQTSLLEHMNNIIRNGVEYSLSGPPFYNALAGIVSERKLTAKIKLKRIAAGGSGVIDADHAFVKEALGLDRYTLFYACSEAMVIGTQLEEKGPYYTFSDRQIVEIVDDNINPARDGEKGKLLVTPLDMDSSPVVRYVVGDEVRYLGNVPFRGHNKFTPVFDNIRRFKDALIGSGLLPLSEIEKMPKNMRENGAVVLGIQIVKQRKSMKDLPVIRLEAPEGQDPKRIRDSAIYAFRTNNQMAYLLDSGEMHEPEVEIYKPGELRGKSFKLNLFVDETSD